MNELILLITGGIGALGTYIVAHDLKQGVIRASAGLSLMVGLFFYTFPTLTSIQLSIEIPMIFLGASFVGMTAQHVIGNKLLILLGGVLFSGIFQAASDIFIGYGGKLGTAACISCTFVFGLQFLLKKYAARKNSVH